jgi:hypothetical protein
LKIKQRFACYLPLTSALRDSFFGPENLGDVFFRNIGLFSTDYTALHPKKEWCACYHAQDFPLEAFQYFNVGDTRRSLAPELYSVGPDGFEDVVVVNRVSSRKICVLEDGRMTETYSAVK